MADIGSFWSSVLALAYSLAASFHQRTPVGTLGSSNRIRTRWAWAELISQAAHELALGKTLFSQEVVHGDRDAHELKLSFRSKSGLTVTLTSPVE